LHNEELHNFHYLSNTQVITSGKETGLEGATLERSEMHTEFWLENLREREHFEDLGEDGRVLAGFIRLVTRSGGWLLWAQ
jgi:hypothetical protein